METQTKPEQPRNLKIPLSTILKLIATAIILAALWHLWDYVMLLFVSLLLAVALDPLVERIRHIPYSKIVLPRFVGILFVGAGTAVLFALLILVAAPTMVEQITALVQGLPAATEKLLASSNLPYAHQLQAGLQNFTAGKNMEQLTPWMSKLVVVGQAAAGGVTSLLLVLVFTVYLLIEGRETYEWLGAFFEGENRVKLDETAKTLIPVISAFVIGQLICSCLCAIYAFTTLSLLHVPAATMLAVLAGLFDILPIIGVIMFTGIAAVMASTVSLTTAGIVVGLYLVYHVFEAYILLPRIYGSKLRLSGLVVLLSILVGASLGGILGAIAILPIVASYPAIEKIWLRRQLGQGVIDRHASVEKVVDAAASANHTKDAHTRIQPTKAPTAVKLSDLIDNVAPTPTSHAPQLGGNRANSLPPESPFGY